MGQQNDLSTQLEIQLNGFKLNLSHFSFLKFLYKKHIFRSFWGLSGGGAVGSTKICARVCYYEMQRVTKSIQKLDPCVYSAG